MSTVKIKPNEQHVKELKQLRKYQERRKSSFGRYIGGNPIPEYIEAKVISKDLAIFNLEEEGDVILRDQWWRVIHIPTGWVIGQVTYDIIKYIRETFTKSTWEITPEIGHFRLIDSKLDWTIICKLRYEIIKD